MLWITNNIDKKIEPLLPGIKFYGVAKSAMKQVGDTQIQMPYNCEKYIGIDDTYPAQLYHKQFNISSSIVKGSGYGDTPDLQAVYDMAMILYLRAEKDCNELYTFIQASVTGRFRSQDYKSVLINVSGVNLNDQQVWKQEYGDSPYKLFDSQRLIQINYTITVVFNKQCINIPACPAN